MRAHRLPWEISPISPYGDDADEDDDALSEAEVGLEELLDDLNLADNETFDDFTPPTIFKLPTGGGDFHFT